MTSYVITERADADLQEIFVFSYKTFGERQADLYIDSLHECFERLGVNPRLGRPANSIARNVRRHEHKAHVILYEETRNGIAVLAVFGAGMLIRLDG